MSKVCKDDYFFLPTCGVYRGYRYAYGNAPSALLNLCVAFFFRFHISTADGIPVEFVFLLYGREAHDTRGLKALTLNLPEDSAIYCDAGYTDYDAEDDFQQCDRVSLKVMRKKNSRRADEPWVAYIKQHLRHPIETLFSQITQRFPKSIHAVTIDGFLMKVAAFIIVFTLESAFMS